MSEQPQTCQAAPFDREQGRAASLHLEGQGSELGRGVEQHSGLANASANNEGGSTWPRLD
jgi:hypothetical protein